MWVGNDVPTVSLQEPIACCLGELTILNGWFADGDPSIPDGPYTVTVNWGDGAVSEEEFATPGSFQFGHEYAAVGFYSITVQVQDDAGAIGAAQAQARVVTVQSVDWVALSSPLDENPGNGAQGTTIGLRIFPDKTDFNENVNRRRVLIRASVVPAIAGVTVHFAAVDVDDPSAFVDPVDLETLLGKEIPDNRGPGTLLNGSAITDANGIALVEFDVSLQAGDNWRAAASCNLAKVTGLWGNQNDAPLLRVVDSDGNFLPNRVSLFRKSLPSGDGYMWKLTRWGPLPETRSSARLPTLSLALVTLRKLRPIKR
jgi:hypothetical protein